MTDVQSRFSLARLSAALIAILALSAMIPPLGYAMADTDGALLAALWRIGRAFTITTNFLVGGVFLWIAFKGRDAVSPLVLGGVMLAIMLVGVIFNLLLDNMAFQTVWAWLGDRIHHMVVPLAVPLWWLAFAEKGRFGWRAPFAWMLYPLAYSAYVMTRAQFEPASEPNRYVYFFMDADRLGWPMAIANMAAIAVGFAIVGMGVVWLDRRLGTRAG